MEVNEKQSSLYQDFIDEWNSCDSISARTSGSTGTPKLISLPKCQVIKSARRTNEFFGIDKNSRIHSAVSFNFIGGKMMIARSLVADCLLTYEEPARNIDVSFFYHPVDLTAMVPLQMESVVNRPMSFNSVKNFLVGGAPISDKLWQNIVSSGISAWESYGMTETASHIALRKIAGNPMKRPPFITLEGIEIELDSAGCLIIHDHEVTVQTNDIAKLHPGGGFEIVGRRDGIINSGGLKIVPEELERILQRELKLSESDFYIDSVPNEKWGSMVILVYIVKPHLFREDIGLELWEKITLIPEDILPRKMRPKEIRLASCRPLTPNGKIRRCSSENLPVLFSRQ